MELIQRKNEINIKRLDTIKILTIEYLGSFVAELQGDAFVIMNEKNITIAFNSVGDSDLLMKYYGNFRIKSLKGIKRSGGSVNIRRISRSDVLNQIFSRWDESTMKYTDYNESFSYSGGFKTLISYTKNGKKYYKDKNNKIVKEKDLNIMQLNKFKKIRGNYGTR